jgi:hypothetical protein
MILDIVLGLIAIGIFLFLWERFPTFKIIMKWLLIFVVVCLLTFLVYEKYENHQQLQNQLAKKKEDAQKTLLREEFVTRHPEYARKCKENSNKNDKDFFSSTNSFCILEFMSWDSDIDEAIQAEKEKKPLPPPKEKF